MGRYDNTNVNRSNRSVTSDDRIRVIKYDTTIYDVVPEKNDDIFIITQEGDRLDSLAFTFYGNAHLWWYIARANNLKSMNVPAETSLRIPTSTEFAKGD